LVLQLKTLNCHGGKKWEKLECGVGGGKMTFVSRRRGEGSGLSL